MNAGGIKNNKKLITYLHSISFLFLLLALPAREHRPRLHGETICYRLNERPYRHRRRDGRLVMARCTMTNDFCPGPSTCRRTRLSVWGTCCVRGHKPSKHYSFTTMQLTAAYIMKTCPCNEHPLTPHIYIGKLGFPGVYIIFLFLL